MLGATPLSVARSAGTDGSGDFTEFVITSAGGEGPRSAFQTLLSTLVYQNTKGEPINGSRFITISGVDPDGDVSVVRTSRVLVVHTLENQPVLTLGVTAFNYTEAERKCRWRR